MIRSKINTTFSGFLFYGLQGKEVDGFASSLIGNKNIKFKLN